MEATNNGCTSARVPVTATINSTAVVTTAPATVPLCPQPFGTLSALFNVTATNAAGYQWQVNTGASWTDIGGATMDNVTISGITETMEGYQYRVSVTSAGGCGTTTSNPATLYIKNVWKGATSSDWQTPTNWWSDQVPDMNCEYLVVPNVSPKPFPLLKGTETDSVRSIVIRKDASVNVTQSSTFQVRGSIYADINNSTYGILDGTDGQIELTGGRPHGYAGTDTAQIIAGSFFYKRTLKNLQISNPLGASVTSTPSDTLNITGTLSFGNVNNVTLNTGDNITLVSNALGTARVADITNAGANNNNNFNGQVIVERYINIGQTAGTAC